jgi:CheY-like chemotaxis protein
VVDHALETVAPALKSRRQPVTVERNGPVPAFVDGTRICQIVGNLVTNASKYSPPGSRIRVQITREADQAVVRIVDEGAGIPPDQLGRVFDMFTKIPRATQTAGDGLGIGLALSRQFAELHGGTLTAASAGEGRGATFTLSVPIQTDHGGAAAPADRVVPSRARARQALSIVVVEDNEDSADMMSTWLEHLGHEVRVARTGPDGVAMVLAAHPDVVLCDIGLPGMDGVDVCRRIVVGMPAPPMMIALTGWGSERDLARTLDAGFDQHLVKPVELEQLRSVLEAAGARARGAQTG